MSVRKTTPRPLQRPGPPIWVASWGSPAGLRRVARLRGGAKRMLADVLGPMPGRPAEALRSRPLLVGPAEVCAARLAALVVAGARRIFLWPLGDESVQLERFRERVVPLVPPPP